MDPKLINLLINMGFMMSIVGAISFLLGPRHNDNFRATTSAITGGGLALVVVIYFTIKPEAQEEATLKLVAAVISGLVTFIGSIFKNRK